MSRRTLLLIALSGAAVGAALRVWAVLLPQGALDADEAVVGLMTHGILHGTLPVFFPGQGYGGTQESFLAAPLVAVFGLETWAIRIVVMALWAASAILVWRIGLRVLDERRAVLAATLFWIWPTYFDWKSTRAHGFYGAELFLGLVILLVVLRLAERVTRRDLVLLGLALGCGLWSSPQVAIVALPALGWLVWRRREVLARVDVRRSRRLSSARLPWLLGNLRHDWYSLHPGRNEGRVDGAPAQSRRRDVAGGARPAPRLVVRVARQRRRRLSDLRRARRRLRLAPRATAAARSHRCS